jgi:DNA-binding NtrC family response regulator
MFKVLVADDDADLRHSVASAFADKNYYVEHANNGEECINRVKVGQYDLVLLDVSMPRCTGLEALKEIKAHDPAIIVLILTAFSNVRDAIEATRQGAYNYLEKPIKAENLVCLVEQAIRAKSMVQNLTLAAPQFRLPNGSNFIGQSHEMKKIFAVIEKLSQVNTAVLIRGESGTGKELVAQALHHYSPRKNNRFVTVNCSAIPEPLIESELFGHEKGAFTGAETRKIGKFQYADGGTLFLDEIGDISHAMQVKLLRVLQEKTFFPIGSNREIEVNLRIVAATHRNLEEMIQRGQFREDLFYRLNVLPIQLPPLRDRKNDIEALTTYFIDKFNQTHKKNIIKISTPAMNLLKNHSWPGNIRELENVIEHSFVIENTMEITPESLPNSIQNRPRDTTLKLELVLPGSWTSPTQPASSRPGLTIDEKSLKPISNQLDFQANKEEFEKQFLIQALQKFKGRINQTALQANIPKKTLLRKLEKYGINARDYSQQNQTLNHPKKAQELQTW